MSYDIFAKYYDLLTSNISYRKLVSYYKKLFRHYQIQPKHIVDLACGTGSLAVELALAGYQVTAVDCSTAMLSVAYEKTIAMGIGVALVEQKMERLRLPYAADAIICNLDSINHLSGIRALSATLQHASSSCKQGGLFIFDVNTLYKQKEILGDHSFVLEYPQLLCCWQNHWLERQQAVEIQLDFFEEIGTDTYLRSQEVFKERFFSHELLVQQLEQHQFDLLDVFAESSLHEPTPTDERVVYIAKKLS